MIKKLIILTLIIQAFFIIGCIDPSANYFYKDIAFLQEHTDVLILTDSTGNSRVAILPALQGRVIISTANGLYGNSYGWFNRALIASGQQSKDFIEYGGEDKFSIGPEGGQFAIFFKNDSPFDFFNWYIPESLSTEPFNIISKSSSSVLLQKELTLTNYSNTEFNIRVDRTIRVLEKNETVKNIAISPEADIQVVAFESDNKITNISDKPWRKETGLLSIWILGMFNPSKDTVIILPYITGPEDDLGPIVNKDYFSGGIPRERINIGNSAVFLLGDGKFRCKVGLSPDRAKNVIGSYDIANKILTIIQYDKPYGQLNYAGSGWQLHPKPYRGDVVNAFNDGPIADIKHLGPYYDLETSSPVAELQPGEYITQRHRTCHFQGDEFVLDLIAHKVLGVTLDEIKKAFK